MSREERERGGGERERRRREADVVVVEPDGETTWACLLDAVWVGDWMSLVLAERAEVDPVDIRFIDHLKQTLSDKA